MEVNEKTFFVKGNLTSNLEASVPTKIESEANIGSKRIVCHYPLKLTIDISVPSSSSRLPLVWLEINAIRM